jgi:hypothetical protein
MRGILPLRDRVRTLAVGDCSEAILSEGDFALGISEAGMGLRLCGTAWPWLLSESNGGCNSMLPLISLKCVWVVLGRGGGVDRCREAWDEDASVPITVAGRRLCCDAGRGSDPSLWLDDDDDADPLEFASKSRSTGGICVLTFLVIRLAGVRRSGRHPKVTLSDSDGFWCESAFLAKTCSWFFRRENERYPVTNTCLSFPNFSSSNSSGIGDVRLASPGSAKLLVTRGSGGRSYLM